MANRFVRPDSAFREFISADGSTPYPAEAGRYHLYVSWACPWAHRTAIARRLKGLEDAITMSAVDPIRDERGWAFTRGEYADPVNGWAFLSEAYERTQPGFDGRVSVPVLWDRETGLIVNNESSEILRSLDHGFGELASDAVRLYPEPLRAEIDAINERVYHTVNNAVYKAGFTTDQAHHEDVVRAMFETLDMVEQRLADQRWLVGSEQPTEADWRLFTTLVRFDAVYATHFKCNLRRIVDYPNLWAYTRELYQWPGVAETVRMDEIKRHYYMTHPSVNPSRLVPLGPLLDFDAPHGRG